MRSFYRKTIICNDPKGERNGTMYRIDAEILGEKYELHYSIMDEISKSPAFMKAMEIKEKYLEVLKEKREDIDKRVKDAINQDLNR